MHERLISALGAAALLACALMLCPRRLRPYLRARTILGGLGVTFGAAGLMLLTPLRWLFVWTNDAVERLLMFSQAGASFVFGRLADVQEFGFVFAFQVLPTIVFFSALMSVAYHVGLMPWVVQKLGRLLSRGLGVSGVESLSTVADIFVGQTEAPLVIKPYLASLTSSELMACMTAGFATTAGGVLAAYVLMLKDLIPGIAGHLVACSVLAAPASLVVAKLMLPEDQPTAAADIDRVSLPSPASGLLDAITMGTSDGLRLAANVGAMLISFLALTAMIDFALGWATSGLSEPLTLLRILSWVFWPLSWLLGVPHEDVAKLAGLLGQKTVMNEFVAYSTLTEQLKADPAWLSERSRIIASYALCGFANFGSIGIQIGGYAALAPERRADFARLGPRAMLAGLLTTCLVACIAGIFA
ncbi:MAG TPA: nucleoside transporter C-terminal domain-containing protein [Polyangiales bacterium]